MFAIVDKNNKQIIAQSVGFTPKRIKEITGLTTNVDNAPKTIGNYYIVPIVDNVVGDISIPLTEIQTQNYVFDEQNLKVLREKTVVDLPLESAKAQLLSKGKTIAENTSKHVLFETHWYQADLEARTRIDGAIEWLASGTGPSTLDWTTSDNAQVNHTETSLRNLKIAGAAHIGAVHFKWISLRDEINAASTVEELRLIDIESGWPESKPEATV